LARLLSRVKTATNSVERRKLKFALQNFSEKIEKKKKKKEKKKRLGGHF